MASWFANDGWRVPAPVGAAYGRRNHQHCADFVVLCSGSAVARARSHTRRGERLRWIKMRRRDFLKSSVIGGTGLLAAACAPQPVAPPGASSSSAPTPAVKTGGVSGTVTYWH